MMTIDKNPEECDATEAHHGCSAGNIIIFNSLKLIKAIKDFKIQSPPDQQ
jgi:hypothetical protein